MPIYPVVNFAHGRPEIEWLQFEVQESKASGRGVGVLLTFEVGGCQ